jgi:hypothetical protein
VAFQLGTSGTWIGKSMVTPAASQKLKTGRCRKRFLGSALLTPERKRMGVGLLERMDHGTGGLYSGLDL